MQLSIDQKIQAAIKPLLERITALEQDNAKFKQQIQAFQTSQLPKTNNHKPVTKPATEQPEKIQTVKGGRKKSTDNHEIKHDNKTDKKNVEKKQDIKGEGQQSKNDQVKGVVQKTPGTSKGVNSPIGNKDVKEPVNTINKDPKNRPSTAINGPKSNNSANNKNNPNDKKNGPKTALETQKKEQKVEGEQKIQEKKQNEGHQKVQKPNVNNIKSPAINKNKQPIPAPPKNEQKKQVNTHEPPKNIKKGTKHVQVKKQQQKKQVKSQQPIAEKTESNSIGQNKQAPVQINLQQKIQTVAEVPKQENELKEEVAQQKVAGEFQQKVAEVEEQNVEGQGQGVKQQQLIEVSEVQKVQQQPVKTQEESF